MADLRRFGEGLTTAKMGRLTGLLMLISACASAPPFEPPALVDDGALRERAVTKVEEDIRVSAAIPSEEESRSIFGVDLESEGIGPLWLEIENGSERPFYFLPTGLDPEYFAPMEVAFLYQHSFADDGALGEHLQTVSFDHRSPILPGETFAGFVYANRADPSLMADIDLLGREWSRSIALLVPASGTEAAQERLTALGALYTEAGFVEIGDETTLRTALEELPCCTTDHAGTSRSLPLNLVLIGNVEEWGPSFARRSYRYTPVSPWYALGREQDASAHKISRWVAPQPHTLRAWLTPLRYRGKSVWVAQVSTALGGRFATPGDGSAQTEPAVDEARNAVVEDLLYSQGLVRLGFVKGVGRVDDAEPRQTLDGSTYYTDGLRAVMVFGRGSVSLAEIDFFDWESLVDRRQ